MKHLCWIMMAALLATAGCKFTMKLPQPTQFADATFPALSFAPSIVAKPAPGRLVVATSRFQPIRDGIDPILLSDISAVVIVDRVFEKGIRVPVELTQGDDSVYLTEAGSNVLAGKLTADLPADAPAKSVRAVEITFRGEVSLCPLAPPAPPVEEDAE